VHDQAVGEGVVIWKSNKCLAATTSSYLASRSPSHPLKFAIQLHWGGLATCLMLCANCLWAPTGGLGHVALQFANKMGGYVAALDRGRKKEAEVSLVG